MSRILSKAIFLPTLLLISCGANDPSSTDETSKFLKSDAMQLSQNSVQASGVNTTLAQFVSKGGEDYSTDPQTQTSYSAIQTRYLPYPSQGVMLGQGWDSFSSKPVGNNCVVFSRQFVPGHDLNISTEEIKSRYQLNKSMKMSMSGSYSGFGAKASAKGSYSKSLDIDQNNTNILATVNIWKGDEYTAPSLIARDAEDFPKPGDSQYYPISLTQEAINILNTTMPTQELKNLSDAEKADKLHKFNAIKVKQFRKLCGDSYVGHIRNGASLSAYLTFESLSREEKQSMSAEISASGWGAKLSGSYSAERKESLDNSSSSISIYQTGGFLNATPMNIADFNKTVSSFTQSSDPNYFPVKPYEVGLMSYANLPNWPVDIPIENPDGMLEVITLYWLFDDLRKDYMKALQFPSQYSIFDSDAQGKKLEFSLTDAECSYDRKVIGTKRVRTSIKRFFSEKRQYRTVPVRSENEWTATSGNVDSCPSGEELPSLLVSEVSKIRKHLTHVTVMQVALREAIEKCRSYSDATNCNSRSIFDQMTSDIVSGYNEVTATSGTASLASFKLPREEGSPMSLASLSSPSLSPLTYDTKTDIEELYGLYYHLEEEGYQAAVTSLTANIETEASEIRALNSAISKLDQLNDAQIELNSMFRDDEMASIAGLEIGSEAMTAAEFNTLANEKATDLALQQSKLTAIKSFNSLDGLKAAIVKTELNEEDFPNTWPFNLVTNEVTRASAMTTDQHWDDMVGAYYYYVAALPIRVKSSSNTVLPTFQKKKKGSTAGADLAGKERTKAMRKVKIDTLLGISESFCETDIIHSLCRPLEQVVSDINSVGIVSFNNVTAVPGRIHHHKHCWRHGLFKMNKSCRYWTTQDPTKYITDIITGEDIEL